MKKAFITGITGQDGSYLAEFLLDKGYEVHGLIRRVALEDPRNRLKRIYPIKDKLILHSGSLQSYSRLLEIFDEVKPDEVYHLGAQSFVHESFDDAFTTFDINIYGTLNVFSALKKKSSHSKVYFAGTSEMFGKVEAIPQDENTKFHPRSPYGISKLAGYEIVRNYRESYGMFACTGILFNHESPRRGCEFVTRKITKTIADIKKGKTNILVLGNLDAKRDWGYAGDYVRAMWLMLQAEKPNDYVVGTGKSHSVREFLDCCFKKLNINYELIDLHKTSNTEADYIISELKNKKDVFVVQHPLFYRPAEVDVLLSYPKKIKDELGWVSETSFEELVDMMISEDMMGG
ncbi:GDP-mannose 4,6-dehydratase [Candidatus Pacearchaeota archaeon]|nr:GDP-mannose 4,6-dehydratase [Candidatus Pacearchaeota archaeon]